ncbi:MAG: ribosome-binding ATPase YchF (GTP1/OBG family) [Pirellulaceae bacterium]|jgi:ribosome-binding ATPase YchF (GTP1/OBG family)
MSHSSQSAMATVVDERVASLCEIFKPKKITQASLEIVDTPGLSQDHEGSAQKLATIREAGCLVFVVSSFEGNNGLSDLSNFDDDLLIADLDIVSNRVDRLKEQVKKPKPDREEREKELAALLPLLARLEEGKSLRGVELNPDQKKATRSFQLLSEKPRFVIINCADDEEDPQRFFDAKPDDCEMVVVSLQLQMDLQQMDDAERADFCEEMGVTQYDREPLILEIMSASNQMLFFTAGEKEVRTWMIPKNCTAVDAAGSIHTDLAKGFIRAATMTVDDLVRLGSEREVKAQSLMRQEPKDYVIQDGDILEIRHN